MHPVILMEERMKLLKEDAASLEPLAGKTVAVMATRDGPRG
jgi:hypothetical protein